MKRDLNLIPRAETTSAANKYILPVILIVVLYAATAYLAITIPQQSLQAKEDEYAILHEKVAALEYVEIEYQLIRQQLAEIEAKKQTIVQTEHSEKDTVNILDQIEQACPEEVLVTEIIISSDGITLTGIAGGDSLVAEFMVNLRAVSLFSNSNITYTKPAEPSFAEVQEAIAAGEELPVVREFKLALAYSAEEILGDQEQEAG